MWIGAAIRVSDAAISFTVPPEKIAEITELLAAAHAARHIAPKQLASLAGKLTFGLDPHHAAVPLRLVGRTPCRR